MRVVRDAGCQAIYLGGVEQVRTATRGGADTVTVDDTSGTELQDVGVDLADAEGGDGRRDRVILNATPARDDPSVFAFAGVSVVGLPAFIHVEGSEPTDKSLTINGRGGDDLLSASTVGDPSDRVDARRRRRAPTSSSAATATTSSSGAPASTTSKAGTATTSSI